MDPASKLDLPRLEKSVPHNDREVKYIEVKLEDIEAANLLAHQVLGQSLDELPPQTRRLLLTIDEMVTAGCERLEMERCDFRFTRRQVREYSGLGDTQLKAHMHRLEELEYLLVHQGGRGQRFVYELLYDGNGSEGTLHLNGLPDVAKLRKEYDRKKSGSKPEKSGGNEDLSDRSRPQVGPKSGGCRPLEAASDPPGDRPDSVFEPKPSENAHLEAKKGVKSYVLHSRTDGDLPLAAEQRTVPAPEAP